MNERDLRTSIETWPASHDPQMAGLLGRHPHGTGILDRAANAVATSLAHGQEIQTEPAAAERGRDEFYLLDHPEGLDGRQTGAPHRWSVVPDSCPRSRADGVRDQVSGVDRTEPVAVLRRAGMQATAATAARASLLPR